MLFRERRGHPCMGTIYTGRIAAGGYLDLNPVQERAGHPVKLFPEPSKHRFKPPNKVQLNYRFIIRRLHRLAQSLILKNGGTIYSADKLRYIQSLEGNPMQRSC